MGHATFGQVEDMQNSKVVEINGVFVGAAVRQDSGWRFVAADPRVSLADGQVAATFREAQALARHAFLSAAAAALPPMQEQASASPAG